MHLTGFLPIPLHIKTRYLIPLIEFKYCPSWILERLRQLNVIFFRLTICNKWHGPVYAFNYNGVQSAGSARTLWVVILAKNKANVSSFKFL